MKTHVESAACRVNGPLRPPRHSEEDPNGDSLMAGTQQGLINQPTSTMADDEEMRLKEMRLTLPEATMFIVASSGALWVLLFGLVNVFLG